MLSNDDRDLTRQNREKERESVKLEGVWEPLSCAWAPHRERRRTETTAPDGEVAAAGAPRPAAHLDGERRRGLALGA